MPDRNLAALQHDKLLPVQAKVTKLRHQPVPITRGCVANQLLAVGPRGPGAAVDGVESAVAAQVLRLVVGICPDEVPTREKIIQPRMVGAQSLAGGELELGDGGGDEGGVGHIGSVGGGGGGGAVIGRNKVGGHTQEGEEGIKEGCHCVQ